MRQKVLFCFFILTFAAVSAGAIETLTLDNGLTVSLDNQLPKSIRGYYTVSGLLSELNNPGRATGIQNFPFSFGLVLKYDDSIGELVAMVTMPKFDMDKVQLTLETGTSPAYIDFGYLDQVLAVIMWWYKDVPYNSKNMDAEIRSALMKSPIELYCIISRNGVSITTYISLSYVKNGIFLDPQFALQYPILINDRQYMPAVTDSSELNSYLSVGRYPVMLINRITNAKSPEAHSIERFFQN